MCVQVCNMWRKRKSRRNVDVGSQETPLIEDMVKQLNHSGIWNFIYYYPLCVCKWEIPFVRVQMGNTLCACASGFGIWSSFLSICTVCVMKIFAVESYDPLCLLMVYFPECKPFQQLQQNQDSIPLRVMKDQFFAPDRLQKFLIACKACIWLRILL